VADWVENGDTPTAANEDLDHGTAPAFGIAVPCIPEAADAHDGAVDIPPVKLMRGRQFSSRRITHD
jgi:hypothetical protein